MIATEDSRAAPRQQRADAGPPRTARNVMPGFDIVTITEVDGVARVA
jgi:hypothetical protein